MCTHKSDVGNSGSKRSRTEEVDGTGVDRISDLPEPLLILILSFLPTLYAVRTSVLSRRWNNLWTRVPGLKFGSELLARKLMFGAGIMRGDFVDSLLLRYNDLNFEELDLGSEWSDDDGLNMLDHLPQTIFSCTTLVVLRLKNLYLMCNALPPSASITCVKTLELDSLRYANDAYESTLISNCVELEDLSIRKDASGYMNDFRVHAQRLKRLKIRIHQEAEYGEDGELYAIHINAPNLLDLDIEDDGLYYPLLADVGNLKKAKIDLNSVNAFKSLLNCFSALKTVESLHLSSSHIKQVCNLEHAGLAVQNVNLTYLTLGVGSVWVRLLPYFFRCFPNLRVLILKKEPSVCKYDGKLCTNPKLLPTGLLSRLEVFVAEEFRGTNVELGLLEYVLKNGKVLDSVQLQCTSNGTRGRELEADYYEDMLRITQKILYFPRASEKCRIMLDREQRL